MKMLYLEELPIEELPVRRCVEVVRKLFQRLCGCCTEVMDFCKHHQQLRQQRDQAPVPKAADSEQDEVNTRAALQLVLACGKGCRVCASAASH